MIALYPGAALVLGLVPVNSDFSPARDGTEVYVVSNGVHVDFVLPLRTAAIDFSKHFPAAEFESVDASHRYLFFGWGERRFYIETPTWGDVKVSTVAAAMLFPTPSVVHVEYARERPPLNEATRRIVLSREQYRTLVRGILESFQKRAGRFRRIPGKGYRETDNFYEGAGRYHLFNTCNMWTSRLLRESGVKTALWSPFTMGILYHLE